MQDDTMARRVSCPVHRLAYDWTTRSGRLDLPPGCCTDMTGTIAVFTSLDSRVTRIETVAGHCPDTVYVRVGDRWQARGPHAR